MNSETILDVKCYSYFILFRVISIPIFTFILSSKCTCKNTLYFISIRFIIFRRQAYQFRYIPFVLHSSEIFCVSLISGWSTEKGRFKFSSLKYRWSSSCEMNIHHLIHEKMSLKRRMAKTGIRSSRSGIIELGLGSSELEYLNNLQDAKQEISRSYCGGRVSIGRTMGRWRAATRVDGRKKMTNENDFWSVASTVKWGLAGRGCRGSKWMWSCIDMSPASWFFVRYSHFWWEEHAPF